MSLGVIQMDEFLCHWAENKLELKGEESFLKGLLVISWHSQLTLSSDDFQNILDVIAMLHHKLVSLLKPDSFYRVDVVAATDDAASKKHIFSESAKVQFLNFT